MNLLAVRGLIKQTHPFMVAELKQKFELDRALQFGPIPLVVNSENSKLILHAYVNLYVKEEVKDGMT